MPSGPPSPVTPSRKRRSLRLSNLDTVRDSISPSPHTSGNTNGTTFSRRSSHTSQTSFQQHSPVTPRPMSSRSSNGPSFHRRRSSRASVVSNMSMGDGEANGLGSLADELGEVWDQEEADGQESGFLDGLREGSIDPPASVTLQSPTGLSETHGLGISMTGQSPQSPSSTSLQLLVPIISQPEKQSDRKGSRHRRHESQYDGSDYGPESDTEDLTDIPPSLAKRLREFEKVTRMSINTDDTLSEDGGVVSRTTRALKDLGPQSGVENGTGRLITAYTSMATHRTHKTRELFSQLHPLLYGQNATLTDLPEEVIDLLLSDISDLSSTLSSTSTSTPIPQPHQYQQTTPLTSLTTLTSDTTSLIQHLRGLADTLTESRQTWALAARKLRSVREMADAMLVEEELRETSILLIQAGDWDRRCRERHAARSCREVVTGFAKTCDVLRERWVRRWEGVVGFG